MHSTAVMKVGNSGSREKDTPMIGRHARLRGGLDCFGLVVRGSKVTVAAATHKAQIFSALRCCLGHCRRTHTKPHEWAHHNAYRTQYDHHTPRMTGGGAVLSKLINDERVVSADLRKIERYVKEELFSRIIFMFNDDQMGKGSFLHRDYTANCKSLVGNKGDIYGNDGDVGPNDEISEPYMTYLWTVIARDRLYRKWLSAKRSNTYQAVQDKFQGKGII